MIPGEEMSRNSTNFLCGVVEGFYGRPWTSEQRKRLFKWMKKMGMNTYLYAPKDDSKHRMYWRDLYSVEEAEALTTLIESANANGVTFVYAISPGLDITFSASKDVTLLKKKLQQVMSFGCSAFALLYDDIEVEMCEADKEIFQSFAQAQVSVTNEVFQHLHEPSTFLFCPTEYCASRAVPNVSSSEYLNTIGSKLLPGVDILWTGPKVISKHISVQSVEELTSVLRRPPVIWDNIHANDYDHKRLFLGPYDGRSTDLIPHIGGVLTNPNNEFEANYIAMHTLCQWYKSNMDGAKKETLFSESPLTADIRLETESDYGSDEESSLFLQSSYKPRKALINAINDWMEEIHREDGTTQRKGPIQPPQVTDAPVPGVNTCMVPTLTTTTTSSTLAIPVPSVSTVSNINELMNAEVNDSYLQPVVNPNPLNSLVDSGTDTDDESRAEVLEPMDCMITPGTTPVSTCTTDSIPPLHSVLHCLHKDDSICDDCSDVKSSVSNCDSMQVDSVIPSTSSVTTNSHLEHLKTRTTELQTPVNERCLLTAQDITLLVDLFYLPFEHGSSGIAMLKEFHWLKVNAHYICENKHKNKEATEEDIAKATEWRERAQKFREVVSTVGKLTERLCNSRNQGLVYDLFPYVWDMLGTANLMGSFVEWIALGEVPYISVCYMPRNPYTWANPFYKQAFTNGEQEPWVFRGGLQGELQRMLPLDNVNDLIQPMVPVKPTSQMLRIRPYMPPDEAAIYEICRKTYNDGHDSTEIFPNYPDLPADKMVGAMLALTSEYCFVVEGQEGVCGYMCAALDSAELQKKAELSWIPQMRNKYPKPAQTDPDMPLTIEQRMVESFHFDMTFLPQDIYNNHPSIVRLGFLPSCFDDPRCPRHTLALLVAALKANGSRGIYTSLNRDYKYLIDLHTKLGYFEIPVSVETNTMLLGRVL